MTHHEHSASAVVSASTLLPTADVIPLPTAIRKRAERGAFTKITVPRMRCHPGRSETFFWDASCHGFGMRTLSSGRRTWVYQYRDEHGRTRRIVFGDVSAVSLEDARDAARRTAASVAHGTNPSVERKKKRAAGTLLEVISEGALIQHRIMQAKKAMARRIICSVPSRKHRACSIKFNRCGYF
jgi:Arm DNA-binding domain